MGGAARQLLELAYNAGCADDLDEFRRVVTLGAGRIVGADLASYTELDPIHEQGLALTDPPVIPGPDQLATLARLAHQHPLINRGTGRAEAISDYLTTRRFHALELYADIYRGLGTEDQLAITLSGGAGGPIVGLVLNRARRGFSARDRETLNTLRPLLVAGYQRAVARTHGRELYAQFLEADAFDTGVIAIGADGRIAFASDAARQLLHAYFGGFSGSTPPYELVRWLSTSGDRFRRRMVVPSEAGRLEVMLVPTAATDQILLELHERRSAPPGVQLTPREREIAAHVATGESNHEVARTLGISRRTVENHLRSIYVKLGVSNRTAAVAALRR